MRRAPRHSPRAVAPRASGPPCASGDYPSWDLSRTGKQLTLEVRGVLGEYKYRVGREVSGVVKGMTGRSSSGTSQGVRYQRTKDGWEASGRRTEELHGRNYRGGTWSMEEWHRSEKDAKEQRRLKREEKGDVGTDGCCH